MGPGKISGGIVALGKYFYNDEFYGVEIISKIINHLFITSKMSLN